MRSPRSTRKPACSTRSSGSNRRRQTISTATASPTSSGATPTGTPVSGSRTAPAASPPGPRRHRHSWQIAGVGDFNGDGKSDILWRNTNGDAYLWNSNGSGGFSVQDLGGRRDKLADRRRRRLQRRRQVRHPLAQHQRRHLDLWNSNGSGGFAYQDLGVVGNSLADRRRRRLQRRRQGRHPLAQHQRRTVSLEFERLRRLHMPGPGVVATNWQIAGVGDFNGDGKSDILWRNTNGDT